MRTRKLFFKTVLISAAMFIAGQSLNSCKKDPVGTTAADVINVEAATKVGTTLTTASTVAALPADVKSDAVIQAGLVPAATTEKFATANLQPEIDAMKARLVLSAAEVTKLKANDLVTFYAVVARMITLPAFTSTTEIDQIGTIMEGNAELSPNLIKVDATKTISYEADFYQGALDLQKFMTDNTLAQLQNCQRLQGTGTGTKSVLIFTEAEKQYFSYMLQLVLVQLRQYTEIFTLYFTDLHNA